MTTAPRQRLTPEPLDLSEGQLNRTIWWLALPVISENLLVTAVHFADALVVGWLRDEVALAAALMAGVVLWMAHTPFEALGVAAASIVARRWGAREFHAAQRAAGQAIAMSAVLALGVTALLWSAAPVIMSWMGAEPAVAGLGSDFMRIALLAAPLGWPMRVANAAIRGSGDTRTPLVTTLIMNVVNVAVSVTLAFGLGPFPALGLLGVAWGTMIARALGGVMVLTLLLGGALHLHPRPHDFYLWRRGLRREVALLAAPAMADRLVGSGAHLVMMKIVALLGTTVLAAHSIALNVESLAFMMAVGTGMAVTTLAGQAIGMGRPDTAATVVRRTLVGAGAAMLALSLLFVFGAPWGVRAFGATPESLRLAGFALQIGALELPMLATTMVLRGCLHAGGDTRSPLVNNLVCIVLFRFGAVYLFAITFDWGLAGVWLGTAAFWAARSGGLYLVWRRGAWRRAGATPQNDITRG